MKKTFIILKNEFINLVTRRSYILTLVLIPLVSFTVMLIVGGLQKGNPGSNVIGEIFAPTSKPTMEGFVDSTKLLNKIPDDLNSLLEPLSNEAEAQSALQNGKITGYYLIPADYIDSGKIVYVRSDYNPLGGLDKTWTITELIRYNLLNDDPTLTKRLTSPMNVSVEYLSGAPERNSSNMLTFFLPYAVTILFYIIILTSSSLMLSSITSEKQNRVLEILMTSVTPTQMLTGKIIALGLAGLLQTVVWSGAGLGLLRLSGQTFSLPQEFQLPFSILVWGVIYFLLGYALYGSLMAGIGALVPNLREASQATTIVILPMIIPMMLVSALVSDPNGALSVTLSLVPLTSPVAMMSRLAAASVPFWQLALSIGLLLITVYLVVRSVAGMFRAQNLLSGQAFNFNVFLKALLGRA